MILIITQADGSVEEVEINPYAIPRDETVYVMRLRDKDDNIIFQFETSDPKIGKAERIEIKE